MYIRIYLHTWVGLTTLTSLRVTVLLVRLYFHIIVVSTLPTSLYCLFVIISWLGLVSDGRTFGVLRFLICSLSESKFYIFACRALLLVGNFCFGTSHDLQSLSYIDYKSTFSCLSCCIHFQSTWDTRTVP